MATDTAALLAGIDAAEEALEKPFECFCGATFRTEQSLNQHQRRVHVSAEREARFGCALCGKRFKTTAGLARHEAVHEGRRFQCPLCPALFTQTSTYNRHYRAVHEGERRFMCQLCEQRFARESDLRRHMTVHDGLMPHECPVCKRRYRLKTHLTRHQSTSGHYPTRSDEDGGAAENTEPTYEADELPVGVHVMDDAGSGEGEDIEEYDETDLAAGAADQLGSDGQVVADSDTRVYLAHG